LGRTLAENILSSKSASNIRAGDAIVGTIGLIFTQDAIVPLFMRDKNPYDFEVVGK